MGKVAPPFGHTRALKKPDAAESPPRSPSERATQVGGAGGGKKSGPKWKPQPGAKPEGSGEGSGAQSAHQEGFPCKAVRLHCPLGKCPPTTPIPNQMVGLIIVGGAFLNKNFTPLSAIRRENRC